jgi:hypothetical protein
MRCLEVYIDRARGAHFEQLLNRLPDNLRYERSEATTQVRRVISSWMCYRFMFDHRDEYLPIIAAARQTRERFDCPVEIWEFYRNWIPLNRVDKSDTTIPEVPIVPDS